MKSFRERVRSARVAFNYFCNGLSFLVSTKHGKFFINKYPIPRRYPHYEFDGDNVLCLARHLRYKLKGVVYVGDIEELGFKYHKRKKETDIISQWRVKTALIRWINKNKKKHKFLGMRNEY